MNRPSLNPEQQRLLLQAVQKRDPSLLPLVHRVGQELIDANEREALRDVLADEFVQFGLAAGDEPNEYGLALDELIGALERVGSPLQSDNSGSRCSQTVE
jgi:hypothetical protein